MATKKKTSVKKAASKMLDATSNLKKAKRRIGVQKSLTMEEQAQFGKGSMKKGFSERTAGERAAVMDSEKARKQLRLNKPKSKKGKK